MTVFVWSVLTVLFIVFHNSDAVDCMTGTEVVKSFVIGDVCFWVVSSSYLTSWSDTIKSCKLQSGAIATIGSAITNHEIASQLDRPAFFGYHKQIDNTWTWVNGTSSYTNTFTENGGVHMAIADGSGNWEATNVDAKGHIYGALCTLPLDPHLKCEALTVDKSTVDNNSPYYAGETVTFTCLEGYQVTVGKTTQTLKCLPHKRWSYAVLDCKPIECDLITPPAYTARDSELHSVGDTVIYSCTGNDTWFAPGIQISQFICGADGNWIPELRPCEFLRCEPPPRLTDGIVDTTSTLYGSTITYKCLNGFQFSDGSTEKSITCTNNPPVWEPAEVMNTLQCSRIFCGGDPGGTSFAQPILPQQQEVGQYQMWYCDVGYRHGDKQVGSSSECQSTLVWIPPLITACIQVGCDKIEAEDTLVNFDQPVYPYEGTITYTCAEEDYVFPGGNTSVTITCQMNGEWTYSPALSGCDESSCEDGWVEYEGSCYYFSNGNSLGLRYEYAEISCNNKFSNLAIIMSDEEAAWIATYTYDIYQRDFWIGIHKDASGRWAWKGDLTTNYTHFAEGYPEFFDCTRTSVLGWWKDRHCDELLPYICKKTSICGVSPRIANGEAIVLPVFPVNVGETITYACNNGFRFQDGTFQKTISCEPGGFWSAIENCIADRCPPLYPPEYQVNGAWFDTLINDVGTIVTITCMDGLLFPDRERVKTIECQKGGNWTDLPADCVKCPVPASSATIPRYGNSSWGSMDYYSCRPGYSFEDAEVEKLFMCTRDGIWVPENQECIRRPCAKYSLPFAKVEPDEGVFEDTIKVECDYGYQFKDTSKIKYLTCTASGEWSEELLPCVPTECEGPTPPNVTNAFRDTDEIASGTKVNYTCLYELVYISGEKTRLAYCDYETLRWTNVPTGCVESAAVVETEHHHEATEAEDAATFGGLGLGILFTFITAIVLLDAATFQRFIPKCKSGPDDELDKLESQTGDETETADDKQLDKDTSEQYHEDDEEDDDEEEDDEDDEEYDEEDEDDEEYDEEDEDDDEE